MMKMYSKKLNKIDPESSVVTMWSTRPGAPGEIAFRVTMDDQILYNGTSSKKAVSIYEAQTQYPKEYI